MKSLLVTIVVAATTLPIFATETANDWKLAKQANGVSIYTRAHPGSKLKEFKAIGELDASTHTVHKVIDDVEAYPKFMPYTAEARVIERNHDSILTYQRISPKIVGDRDYTIRIHKRSWPAETGVAYLSEWKQANLHGPPQKPGVFRVNLVDGSWLLEPVGANKTRATYSVFTDSGTGVPAFLVNKISETGIVKLFAAVRKQAREPKYQTK